MQREERLIIYNQLQILKHLDPSGKADYEHQQKIIQSGYTSYYNDVFGPVGSNEADRTMQEEVIAILNMFRSLNIAKVAGWLPSDPKRALFEGFDGNNDPHYHFAGFILEQEDSYEESAPNKNSHSSGTLHRYRRMLNQWNNASDRYSLTQAEAEAIIKA